MADRRIRVPHGFTLIRPGFARGPRGGYYRCTFKTFEHILFSV